MFSAPREKLCTSLADTSIYPRVTKLRGWESASQAVPRRASGDSRQGIPMYACQQREKARLGPFFYSPLNNATSTLRAKLDPARFLFLQNWAQLVCLENWARLVSVTEIGPHSLFFYCEIGLRCFFYAILGTFSFLANLGRYYLLRN